MATHNPPHPGEFITSIYLQPIGISGRDLAEKLDVAASTLSRVLKVQAESHLKWRCGFPIDRQIARELACHAGQS